MFRINIQVRGLNESMVLMKQVVMGVSERMTALGDDTVDFMRATIKNSAKRGSAGTLGNAIKRYNGMFGPNEWVGVGKVDELPVYW